MRTSFAYLMWLGAILGSAGSVQGGIAYHFMPGVEGQKVGYTQFAQVAPQYGDKNFKVTLSGAKDGFAPSNAVTSARAYLDKWGLGVLNPMVGKDVGLQGQVQLDGKHGGEFLRLEFPQAVRLTLLTFASVGIGEDVDIFGDGVLLDLDAMFPGTKSIREISLAQGNWPGTINFAKANQQTMLAQRWDFVVRSTAFGDGVQLENVEIEAVPEPSTIVLLSLGLVGVGIWSVRRRK